MYVCVFLIFFFMVGKIALREGLHRKDDAQEDCEIRKMGEIRNRKYGEKNK